LPNQAVFAAVDSLDVELLAGLNAVLLPQLRRQDELALAGNSGFHGV
jgi:hypothetical protein